MAVQKYASMAGLRDAIRRYRVIRFFYNGREYEVEPHDLSTAPLTGTFEVTCWVRKFPDGSPPAWKKFHYWKIRAMEVMPDTFLPRRFPGKGVSLAGSRGLRGPRIGDVRAGLSRSGFKVATRPSSRESASRRRRGRESGRIAKDRLRPRHREVRIAARDSSCSTPGSFLPRSNLRLRIRSLGPGVAGLRYSTLT